MTNVTLRFARRFLSALGLLLGAALLPSSAGAGVATAGAVLLDPFDPVPAIQFHHFGGYGCTEGCGGGYDRCGDGCGRRARCDDGCGRRHHRDRCDDGCRVAGHRGDDGDHGDGGRDASGPPPCGVGRCFDIQHWERNWRQGDQIGQEWFDRGYRARSLDHGGGAPGWFAKHPDRSNDGDEDGPPPVVNPPQPGPDDHHDARGHLVCIGLCFGWH